MSGTELATAYISLVPSLKGAQGAISSELGGLGGAGGVGGKALGGGIISGLKGALGPVAGIAAGFFGAKAIVDWGKEQIAALGRIETINAQTEAAIKSTGGAAQVSATHIENLAGALENTTATEAESIQQGANLLLTFKNIRNEAGEGNDIFDQTTTAMVDMARAMGTDAQGGAIQLGKALNDPIKGISALSRVGITFSEDQKALITSLTESGNVMEAQKIILAELNSQFGGSGAAYAETYAGKIELLGHAWGTFGETLFTSATPAIGAIASSLTGLLNNVLTPFAQKVTDSIGFIKGYVSGEGSTVDVGWLEGPLSSVAEVVISMQSSFGGLGGFFSGVWTAIGPLVTQVLGLWQAFSPLSLIFQVLQPILPQLASVFQNLAGVIGGSLITVLSTLMTALQPVITILTGQLSSILQILLPIFAQLAGNIAGQLASALTLIAPMIATLATTLGTVLGTVLTAISPLIELLAGLIGSLLQAVLPIITPILALVAALLPLLAPIIELVGALLTPLIQLLTALLTPIIALIEPIVGGLAAALTFLVNILVGVIKWIVDAITWFVNLVGGSKTAQAGIAAAWNAVGKLFSDVWTNIQNVFNTGITNLVNFVGTLKDKVLGALGAAGSWLLDVGKNIVQGLIDGVSSMVKNAVKAVTDIGGEMLDGVKGFLGIHSPSRRARDEVGIPFGEGIIEGTERISGSVNAALRALVEIPDPESFAPSLSGVRLPSTVNPSDFAAGGRGDVTQINHFGPSEDEQLTLRRAGRELAEELAA